MKCLLVGGRWLSWWSRFVPRWCLSSSSWAPPHRRPSWYNYTDRRAALGRHKQRARVPGNTEQSSWATTRERRRRRTNSAEHARHTTRPAGPPDRQQCSQFGGFRHRSAWGVHLWRCLLPVQYLWTACIAPLAKQSYHFIVRVIRM